MTAYFSYGANMDPVHMAAHCPGAARLGHAVLADYSIGLGAAGFATVREHPGRAVHGILWRLTEADEAALDEFEDVAGGFYRKDAVSVRRDGSPDQPAMIYRAMDDRPGPPDEPYLARVLEVAIAEQLPAAYVRRLQALGGAPQSTRDR